MADTRDVASHTSISFQLVINAKTPSETVLEEYDTFEDACRRFLTVSMLYLGNTIIRRIVTTEHRVIERTARDMDSRHCLHAFEVEAQKSLRDMMLPDAASMLSGERVRRRSDDDEDGTYDKLSRYMDDDL